MAFGKFLQGKDLETLSLLVRVVGRSPTPRVRRFFFVVVLF